MNTATLPSEGDFSDITDPICRAIIKEYEKAKERKWKLWYAKIDIHDTLLPSNYQASKEDIPREFYPFAIKVMQKLSKRKDLRRILDSSTPEDHIEGYLEMFEERKIYFDYVNKNPEVENEGHGNFKEKYYFNFALDDKAGFDPLIHWEMLDKLFDRLPELVGEERIFEISVAVMRIQSPFGPHPGHEHFLKEVFRRGKKVLIDLACEQVFPSEYNPFSFEVRKFLLEQWITKMGFQDREYRIADLPNRHYNDDWSKILDANIASFAQDPTLSSSDIVLCHSRDGFGKHYTPHGRYPILEISELPGFSATDVRSQVKRMKPKNNDQILGMAIQQMKQPTLQFLQTRVIFEDREGRVAVIKYSSINERDCRLLGGYVSTKKDRGQSILFSLKRKLMAKTTYQDLGEQFTLLDIISFSDWKYRESKAMINCAVYHVITDQVIKFRDDYHDARIEKLVYVDKANLHDVLDPEERVLLAFVK